MGSKRTELVVSGPFARCGGRAWYLSIDGLDGGRGSTDVGRAGVDGSDRLGP